MKIKSIFKIYLIKNKIIEWINERKKKCQSYQVRHSHVILKNFFLYYESNMIMILKNAIYEKIYIGILTMIKNRFCNVIFILQMQW